MDRGEDNYELDWIDTFPLQTKKPWSDGIENEEFFIMDNCQYTKWGLIL